MWCSFQVLPCFSPSFMSYIIHTHYFHFIHWVKIYYSHYFDPQNFSRFGQWKLLVDGFYVLLTCSHYYLSNFWFSGIRCSRLIMFSLLLAKNQPYFRGVLVLQWRMVFRNQDLSVSEKLLFVCVLCICLHLYIYVYMYVENQEFTLKLGFWSHGVHFALSHCIVRYLILVTLNLFGLPF